MIQEDRTALQTSLGINVVVEAGAGTGKTTLLIDRLCLSVLAQGIPVEKLVALTFTEKAAAEIKTRFIFKLQALLQAVREHTENRTLSLLRSNFNVSDQDIISRAEKALARLDRASIGTIHGFCAEILKAFPLEAGLPPNVQIDEGTQGSNLFEARWNHFLDEELGLSAARKTQWKQVLTEVSLDDLKVFARELCSGKIEQYDYYQYRKMMIGICREKITRAQELIEQFLKNPDKPRAIEKALQWATVSLTRTETFLNDNSMLPDEWEAPTTKPSRPKDWEENAFEEALSLYQFAAKVTPEKQRIFLVAYQLVAPLVALVRQDYREIGLLSFDDLIVKTRNLLRSNFYVRRLLKEKFDVLFIDEFQDTDPVQGELLLFLAEEKPQAAERWQEVKLLPGKLFIVGDPKQSIYRFRGADITAYELFTNLILQQGGKKFFLQRNFRSTPEIIDTANSICSRAMVQQTSFQPAYVPIYTPQTQRCQSVQWLFINAGKTDLSADDFRQNQAEQIARWIKKNVGVTTLKDGRKLAYRDIALLLRASTQTSFYTDAFRRHSIPFNVEVDKDFFRKQEINDFLNFLQVISNPSNKIALAGVLRSPLVGMTDEELYQLSLRGELSLSSSTKDPKAHCAYEMIRKFVSLAGRVSTAELVRRVFEDTFLPQICAAAYEGARSISYLQQLVKLVESYHTQDISDAASFFERLQQEVQENPDLLSVSKSDEALDAVSILTVHKSKGLEFPVVILADLTRQDSAGSADPTHHIFSWQYNMHGLRVGNICDINLAFLEEEQKQHSKCEEIRVLYVSLTRAREKLLLVGDERLRAGKAAAPFVQAGLFPDGEKKIPFVQDGDLVIPITYEEGMAVDAFRYRQPAEKKATSLITDISKWKDCFHARCERYELLKHQAHMSPSEQNELHLLTKAQQEGAALGTLCHHALELLLSQPGLTLDKCLSKATQQHTSPFVEQARSLLKSFIQSPLYKQISACKVLACELPFSYLRSDGNVSSGVVDVLLEKPDGSLWIVDYKTDKVLPGKEDQLLREKYADQLHAYQVAIQKLFQGKKVSASAIFIRTFADVKL